MTCIVGSTNGQDVWLGGDSFTGNGSYWLELIEPKVVCREVGADKVLMGASGSGRAAYLLRSMDMPMIDDMDVYRWVSEALVESIRTAFRAAGHLKKLDEVEEVEDLSFLVGVRGRLFGIWGNFTVVESQRYLAVGSGMYAALGALHALWYTASPATTEEELLGALAAAEAHNPYVRAPFHIVSTWKDEQD